MLSEKLIIFDFDGTIADTLPVLFDVVNDLADTFGYKKVVKKDIASLRAMSVLQIFRTLHVPLLRVPCIARRIRVELQSRMKHVQPVTSIKPLLLALRKKGCTLGILTSNAEENVVLFLKKNRLDIFDFVYSEPGIFRKGKALSHIVQKQRLSASDAAYVGDEVRDVKAARKAGICSVAVTWGFNSRKALEKQNADFVVDSPRELGLVLGKLSE